MLASAFEWAPGEIVNERSSLWTSSFIREWGRTLGRLHRVAAALPRSSTFDRWMWHEEIFLAGAERLIPPTDTTSIAMYRDLVSKLHALPSDSASFGMIHGDFAPRNFHVDADGTITVFDFGNCCRNWYVADLTVSVLQLRRASTPANAAETLLEGYRDEYPLDASYPEIAPLFEQLRILYVYLSRLMKFGATPSEEETQILAELRSRVHACRETS